MTIPTPLGDRLVFTSDHSLSFRHNIYYSTKGVIPAAEVAEALLALDRIVQRTPRVLQAIGGGKLPKVALYVEKLQEGSLEEDVIVTLLFGSKEQMNRTLKKWKKTLGIDLRTAPGMIRAIIIALLLIGGYKAASLVLGSGEKPAQTIEIKDNIVINIGADFKMTGEEFVQLVDSVVTKKLPLANDAIKVLAPAKKDPSATIKFDGQKSLTIPRAFIDSVPSEVPAPDSTDSQTVRDTEIKLRANDLDNSEKGWAAVVPAVSDRRYKLEIAQGINADDLFGKRSIKGTVEVIRKPDGNERLQIRAYRLTSIKAQ